MRGPWRLSNYCTDGCNATESLALRRVWLLAGRNRLAGWNGLGGSGCWLAELAGRTGWQNWLAELAGRTGWQNWLAAGYRISTRRPGLAPLSLFQNTALRAQYLTLDKQARPSDEGPRSSGPPPDFADYEILGELGRGAAGVVYRARDRRRNHLVALKTLHRLEPAWLQRFKDEFRVLESVSHPNLVTLYQLESNGQVWFFTMELIEGCDFLRYVLHGSDYAAYARSASRSTAPQQPPPVRELTPPQLERLREALRQLVVGVNALHQRGIVHRDIKPSNVLVSRQGRVVLLDFGLAIQLHQRADHVDLEQQLVGTAYYMSPEQSSSRPISSASDWYSVGAMLYEALTGRHPFIGKIVQVILAKELREPTPPIQLIPSIPRDLNDLCVELLRRDPGLRPSDDELLELFHLPPGGTTRPEIAGPADVSLVGREAHLRRLHECFQTVRDQRRAVSLLVHGRSGQGKSVLLQRFLDEIREDDQVVVLSGRCYERESVPYKAIDSLVDHLTDYLRGLAPEELDVLIPDDAVLLARIFPVLRQVRTIGEQPQADDPTGSDRQLLRSRAFLVLRELVTRLARQRTLVLCIDDLQWGDVDSASLLFELLLPPSPPPLLLLGSYRSDHRLHSPFLRNYRELCSKAEHRIEESELEVGPLSAEDALQLAHGLLGTGGAAAWDQAREIAQESGGNPYFLAELAQHVLQGSQLTGARQAGRRLQLDDVLWERVQQLPQPQARRLLEMIAVAGQPLPIDTAYDAAEIRAEGTALLTSLQMDRLVRTVGEGEELRVETYHDRIREAVVRRLPADRLQDCHRGLATALERRGGADAELLAVHLDGAGRTAEAGRWYALAADQAAETLAFDRAAALYQSALDRRPGHAENPHLQERMADSLAHAGQGVAAARAYLAAARAPLEEAADADPERTRDLKRRAAMQFMFSGHLDEGMETVREVLLSIGTRLPATPLESLLLLLWRRFQLTVRGLGYRERSEDQIPLDELQRIDTCWSIGTGLGVVDPIRGAEFQTRSLLRALQAGEPYRIARALAWEAGHVSTAGGASRRQTARLLEEADLLAQRVRHPHALGIVSLAKGIAAYLQGRWQTALEFSDRAAFIFQEQCTGVAWELDTAQTFALWSLTYLGELAELGRRRQRCVQEARTRGDLYALTNFSTYIMSLHRLAADQPDEGRKELQDAVAAWTQSGFHVQHHNALLADTLFDLYSQQGRSAWQRIQRVWPLYRRSLLLRVQQVRIDVLQSRARCALATAADDPAPQRLLQSALRDARRLDAERMPWASALSQLIKSGVAAALQDVPQAVSGYRRAARMLDDVDMRLFAAAARRRCGELLPDDEGRPLIELADDWLERQQVRAPLRIVTMVIPDFRRGPARPTDPDHSPAPQQG